MKTQLISPFEQLPEGITVAVCTHNGAGRLPQTLAHIAAQEGDVPFELLVVDNASTDDTADAVHAHWPKALANRLRIVRENIPGVANARARALREARYRVLSFIDDDNWISSNWVTEISRIFSEHPDVGLIHVPSRAYLRESTPKNFDDYSGWLAIGSLCKEEGIITRRPASFWTAGLSLRRQAVAFLDDPEFTLALVGRTGDTTLGGDDHELCLCSLLSGWEAYYTEAVSFVHDIPPSRLDVDYFARLLQNSGKSRWLLNIYRAEFDPATHRTGTPLLVEFVIEYIQRAAAYHLKRMSGRLAPGVTPNFVSYHLSRGKLQGYFLTSGKEAQARRNIAIARRFFRENIIEQLS